MYGMVALCGAALAAEDIVIADCESDTYGDWKVEGDAFGAGPAAGTLPHQGRVYNYQGHKYVSSYHTYRPPFHFTARRARIGDPNGLVYFAGEYHLFCQYSPYEVTGGDQVVWAHAISTDLFHWVEYPPPIWSDKLGVPFSGSRVVDWKNTSGLVGNPVKDKNGLLKNPAIVVFYTSEPMRVRGGGRTSQSMAYSLDSGRTWTKYPGNPVVPHIVGQNRDPKVFWYEDRKNPGNPYSGRWIMALYLDGPHYALLASKDLLHWDRTCAV
jgi:sucrose-6-phosphate hydrolase SacC (GH32 family)